MTQPVPDANTAASTAAPVLSGPPVQAWHSIPVLIGVGAIALLTAIATGVGGANFPINAPVEQIYASGLIVDMVAVAIVMTIFTVVEFRRRADPLRQGLPPDTRRSVQAIVAVILAGVTVVAWVYDGGVGQLINLAQGVRGRYMFHAGGIFIAGIPWVLSLIFGAWGFHPRGNRTTNVLALIAVGVGVVLAVIAAAAALIYGAGLSD
jgi:hypothetical protein